MKWFTVKNNNLLLIKTFTVKELFMVSNNCLPSIKLFPFNNKNLLLIKIVTVNNY